MAQSKTKTVQVWDLIKSRAFGLGFADYRAGLAFRDDNDSELRSLPRGKAGGIWAYERGRMFAACYNKPLRTGRAITEATYRRFVELLNDRSIL
jgi:hypothetical protein